MDNIVLSPIPLEQLLTGMRALIKEELQATSASSGPEAPNEIIDRKELMKRLGIELELRQRTLGGGDRDQDRSGAE